MNNQITTPKIDWRTKKVSDHDLAIKLFNATTELYQFIHKNSDNISFANVIHRKKRKGTGETIYTKVPGKNFPVAKWIKPIYDIVEKQTNYTSGRFDINIDGREYSRISLTTKDYICPYPTYTSSVKCSIELILDGSLYFQSERNIQSMINNTRIFIKQIPKKSRNKIVKMLYWHESKPLSERGLKEYSILFKRMKERFDMHLIEKWSSQNKIQFDRITKTYNQIDDRNRKLNKLLRRK